MKSEIVFLLMSLLFFSCKQKASHKTFECISEYEPCYATGFKILYFDDYKLLTVGDCQYFLTKKSVPMKSDSIWIQIPVQQIACMSQSHWAATVLLNTYEAVKGISDANYVSDTLFKRLLLNGKIKDIAENQSINYERLLSIEPQLLMISFDNQQLKNILHQLGIPIVFNADFLENHPLGRAEWLIFMAAFFDKEEEAKKIFNHSVEQYNALCRLTSDTNNPTIIDGNEMEGVWYVTGGKSYMAQFYSDAGASYLWKENQATVSFPVDFELMYAKGLSADYWRTYLPQIKTYQAIKQKNIRYADFKAWKQYHVFYSDNLNNNLYGAGVYQPEVILADMIKIFHPELLPDHQPIYYDLLK